MNTHALIPAGGQSRRMGLNKVLLPRSAKDSTPIWAHVAKLAAARCQTVTVIAAPGTSDANHANTTDNVRIVHDSAAYQGPLQALAGAWPQAVPADAAYVFLLASDLPGLTAAVLSALQEAVNADPFADGAIVMREGRRQPLLGIYRAHAGEALVQHAKTGSHRLLPAFEELELIEVDEQQQHFPEWWTRPVHTPADYAEWLRVSTADDYA